MTGGQWLRTVLNWVNLTTLVGLLIAVAGRTRVRRGPGGLLIAGDYRLPVPKQTCLTMGNLVLCRRPVAWLLADDHADLLRHEMRHASQYALLGPFFWPLYLVASFWSWLVTGGYGARNIFERHAGLDAGGYADLPLRPWAARLARTPTSKP